MATSNASDDAKVAPMPYERYCSSSPFKFLVGRDRQEFTIHSALVAHQSAKLNALVNNGMEEANESCVNWEEEDVDTFLRFGQYAYTGAYDAAKPEKGSNASTTNSGPIGRKERSKPARQPTFDPQKEMLWNRFISLYPEAPPSKKVGANEPGEVYTEVFLSHIKVYVFANYHGIETLQVLALQKLRKTLANFTLHEQGLRDVVQLVRYCFENTPDGDGFGGPLRDLVSLYAACKLEDLWKSREFRGLMDLPEFSTALVTEVMDRLW